MLFSINRSFWIKICQLHLQVDFVGISIIVGGIDKKLIIYKFFARAKSQALVDIRIISSSKKENILNADGNENCKKRSN